MRTALLFGSSGLVGGHLLYQLIKDKSYSKIKIFVRTIPELSNPKVEIIKTDFYNLQNHEKDVLGNDCFFCIGTTKKSSSDKGEYKRVELEIPKEIAKIAKSNLLYSFIFISAIYANPESSIDYLRFKGLVEEELKKLKFPKLVIMRPSFLMGDRRENRASEKIFTHIFKFLAPILIGSLEKIKPIHSKTVAKAMLAVVQKNVQQTLFESNEIVEINKL